MNSYQLQTIRIYEYISSIEVIMKGGRKLDKALIYCL